MIGVGRNQNEVVVTFICLLVVDIVVDDDVVDDDDDDDVVSVVGDVVDIKIGDVVDVRVVNNVDDNGAVDGEAGEPAIIVFDWIYLFIYFMQNTVSDIACGYK